MATIADTLISNSSMMVDHLRTQANAKDLTEFGNSSEIEKTAEDFEAVFLTQMIKTMFDGVETDEVFGGGHGEDVFKTFLFDEYGKVLSKAGGIGIAEDIQRSLLAFQEV